LFRQSLEIGRLLVSVEPTDARTLSNLGGVYNNLGLLFNRQQHYPEAEGAFQQAIKFQKQAVEAAPAATTYRELLGNHYANYAKCLRNQRKLSAADDVARQRKALLASQPSAAKVNPQN
jgi:tetratricopeptide (TPR) repeat protein